MPPPQDSQTLNGQGTASSCKASTPCHTLSHTHRWMKEEERTQGKEKKEGEGGRLWKFTALSSSAPIAALEMRVKMATAVMHGSPILSFFNQLFMQKLRKAPPSSHKLKISQTTPKNYA